MGKSVLDTIREYRQQPGKDEALRTVDLELDLCDRMVELRDDCGLTQRQLGEKLGFTQGYIAKLENGGYDRCGIGTLRTFAIALGHDIDLDHFFVPLEGYQWPCHVLGNVTIVANPNEASSLKTLGENFAQMNVSDGAEMKLAA